MAGLAHTGLCFSDPLPPSNALLLTVYITNAVAGHISLPFRIRESVIIVLSQGDHHPTWPQDFCCLCQYVVENKSDSDDENTFVNVGCHNSLKEAAYVVSLIEQVNFFFYI